MILTTLHPWLQTKNVLQNGTLFDLPCYTTRMREELKRIAQSTNPIRFTSQTVLTVGASAGWADPIDPKDVDFSHRPSIFGAYQFDNNGRPLNPYRKATQMGDRGHLGKWGVNQAADSVVICRGDSGDSYILLVQRQDTKQWALPGGMVDKGEKVSVAAKREVLEETGVDATDLPATAIFKGYVDDPRNTQNAWIETIAYLIFIDHMPQAQSDDNETVGSRWFKLTTPQKLIDETGSLYASHAAIIEKAIPTITQKQDVS